MHCSIQADNFLLVVLRDITLIAIENLDSPCVQDGEEHIVIATNDQLMEGQGVDSILNV